MAQHWRKHLSPPIVLNGSTTLRTLLEAAEFMQANCQTLTGQALDHTLKLLMAAAETGTAVDRRAATDQLRSFLVDNCWL